MVAWMEMNGCERIFLKSPTSKRSTAIIDFAITNDNSGWRLEVLEEGTSDHYPILFSSPYLADNDFYFRKTN